MGFVYTRLIYNLDYRHHLFTNLEEHLEQRTKPRNEDQVVPTLASCGAQMTKEDVVKGMMHRGLKRKENFVGIDDVEEEGSRRRRKT